MANYEVHVFRIYYLRIFPLWGEDSESVELGKNLEEIIKKIVSEKSISGFIGKEKRPFRFCQVEEEEAVFLVQYGKTFFGKERSPVWKVIVPRSVIYSREMIMSCISRGGGSNVEKYKNAQGDSLLYRQLYPDANRVRKYPLVIFLHGSGERGNDNEAQLKWGVNNFASDKNLMLYPAFVIAPQCPTGCTCSIHRDRCCRILGCHASLGWKDLDRKILFRSRRTES